MSATSTLRGPSSSARGRGFGETFSALRLKFTPLLAALAFVGCGGIGEANDEVRSDIHGTLSDVYSGYESLPEGGSTAASGPGAPDPDPKKPVLDSQTLRSLIEVSGPNQTNNGYSIGLTAPGVQATLTVVGYDNDGGATEVQVVLTGSGGTKYVVLPATAKQVDVLNGSEILFALPVGQ